MHTLLCSVNFVTDQYSAYNKSRGSMSRNGNCYALTSMGNSLQLIFIGQSLMCQLMSSIIGPHSKPTDIIRWLGMGPTHWGHFRIRGCELHVILLGQYGREANDREGLSLKVYREHYYGMLSFLV